MKKNAFTEALYKNAGYISVILISLVYVANSFVVISKTGKSIQEIIGTGILSLIVGVLITGTFRSIGIRKGDESEKMISTNELHALTVEEIILGIDKLDLFCERENKRTLKGIRTRILAKVGLKYSECFDEDGTAKELELLAVDDSAGKEIKKTIKKRNRARKKAYKKAVNLKIKPLLSSNLTSDGVNADNPYDFGNSKRQYTKQKSASDIASRVLMAIIFGYFSVNFATNVDFASLIWNLLQIVMYIVGGIIQMYTSYMWIVDDYRSSIIKKIDYLQKFKNCMDEFDERWEEENVEGT